MNLENNSQRSPQKDHQNNSSIKADVQEMVPKPSKQSKSCQTKRKEHNTKCN